MAFAEQSFFDELAEKIGKDEVELRMELLETAIPVAAADEKIEYTPARMQGCIQLVTEKAGWGKQKDDVSRNQCLLFSQYPCCRSS